MSCLLLPQGEDESDVSAPEMLTHHRGGHRRPQPRHMAPAYDVIPHHRGGGHRAAHRGIPEHYPQAALHMAHPRDQEEEDSGASEADLLCSEVLSESHDEGSEAGSEELYARRYHRGAQVTQPPPSPTLQKSSDVISHEVMSSTGSIDNLSTAFVDPQPGGSPFNHLVEPFRR